MPSNCVGFSSSPHLSGESTLSLPARYVDIEQIGQGATCLVLKAHDKFLDRAVAIKYMKPEVNDFTSVRRFQQEAKVMSSFSIMHLPTVLDFGLSRSGRPYMVMELVDGTCLKQVIQERGRLDLALTIEITLQILSALNHAHDRGIIHRDLKAQNILVTWLDGNVPLVKVVDFGLASGMEGHLGVTGFGAALGTPLYMSPEQAQGQASDARSDIYSLGCVIFEMLTGRTPFESNTVTETIDAHVRMMAPSLGSFMRIDEENHCEMEAIVAKTLEKSAAKRYQDAVELEAVLLDLQSRMIDSPPKPWKRFLDTVAELDKKHSSYRLEPPRSATTNQESELFGFPERIMEPAITSEQLSSCSNKLYERAMSLASCGLDLYRTTSPFSMTLWVIALVFGLVVSFIGLDTLTSFFDNLPEVPKNESREEQVSSMVDVNYLDIRENNKGIKKALRQSVRDTEWVPNDFEVHDATIKKLQTHSKNNLESVKFTKSDRNAVQQPTEPFQPEPSNGGWRFDVHKFNFFTSNLAGFRETTAEDVLNSSSQKSWDYVYKGKFHVAGADFWALPAMEDEDLKVIAKMPQVKNVNLISADLKGYGLSYLKGLPIEKLDLRSQTLSPSSFDALLELPKLEILLLDHVTTLNPVQLHHLRQIKTLKTLTLRGIHLHKSAQSELAHFTQLENLSVDFTVGVDESILNQVATMPNLKWFSFRGLDFSRDAIKEFRQKRPDVKLEH